MATRTWQDALSDFRKDLIEIGFVVDNNHSDKLRHPSSYTVWLVDKTWRYSDKGGSKAVAHSGIHMNLRDPVVYTKVLAIIKKTITSAA